VTYNGDTEAPSEKDLQGIPLKLHLVILETLSGKD
jgi:hypothetical protein